MCCFNYKFEEQFTISSELLWIVYYICVHVVIVLQVSKRNSLNSLNSLTGLRWKNSNVFQLQPEKIQERGRNRGVEQMFHLG